MICDAHMHFFSRAFFSALAAEAAAGSDRNGEDLLDDLVRSADIELPPSDHGDHAGRWLAELERHDVERAVVFASHPKEREAVLEGCRRAPNRLIPYVLVDPSTADGREAGRRSLADAGFRGVIVFPAIHHFDPSDRALDPLWEEAADRGAPVVVHCGLLQIKLRDLFGVRPTYDLRFATPLNVLAAAERHRRTRFVLPHFGGGYFAEALLAGAQSENIFVDTSSSNSWMNAQPQDLTLEKVFRKTLDAFGLERVLFGTDSSVFPRGWRADLLKTQREALETIGLDAEQRARIFGGNLTELLRLR